MSNKMLSIVYLAWVKKLVFSYYLVHFCYYLWISLYFLVLFMDFTVLFQLPFNFIYITFNKKFLILTK